MMNVTQDEFKEMSIVEQGMVLIGEGKHLTQVQRRNKLFNLYSLNDFFVEVYYSLLINQIERIEVITDLSRIDLYIEASQKEEKLHLN